MPPGWQPGDPIPTIPPDWKPGDPIPMAQPPPAATPSEGMPQTLPVFACSLHHCNLIVALHPVLQSAGVKQVRGNAWSVTCGVGAEAARKKKADTPPQPLFDLDTGIDDDFVLNTEAVDSESDESSELGGDMSGSD